MPPDYLNFENKKILITGASSGIGYSIATLFSALGARLVLVARNEDRLQALCETLCKKRHIIIPMDLTGTTDYSDLFKRAVTDGNKLDGLVHSAGMSQVLAVNMLSYKRMLKEMHLNYFSFIELVRQYSKSNNNNGGSIIGISSIAADRPEKCQTNYAASKAAMDIAAQSLALELSAKNIRINTILPGITNTQMLEQAQGRDIEYLKRTQTLGVLEPENVASACAFLISDMSRMMTGRRLFMDGGRLL